MASGSQPNVLRHTKNLQERCKLNTYIYIYAFIEAAVRSCSQCQFIVAKTVWIAFLCLAAFIQRVPEEAMLLPLSSEALARFQRARHSHGRLGQNSPPLCLTPRAPAWDHFNLLPTKSNIILRQSLIPVPLLEVQKVSSNSKQVCAYCFLSNTDLARAIASHGFLHLFRSQVSEVWKLQRDGLARSKTEALSSSKAKVETSESRQPRTCGSRCI